MHLYLNALIFPFPLEGNKKKESHFKEVHTLTPQFGITPLSVALASRIERCQANTSLDNNKHLH